MLVSPPLINPAQSTSGIKEREKRELEIKVKKEEYENNCGGLYKDYMNCLKVSHLILNFFLSLSKWIFSWSNTKYHRLFRGLLNRNDIDRLPCFFFLFVIYFKNRKRFQLEMDYQNCWLVQELKNQLKVGMVLKLQQKMI